VLLKGLWVDGHCLLESCATGATTRCCTNPYEPATCAPSFRKTASAGPHPRRAARPGRLGTARVGAIRALALGPVVARLALWPRLALGPRPALRPRVEAVRPRVKALRPRVAVRPRARGCARGLGALCRWLVRRRRRGGRAPQRRQHALQRQEARCVHAEDLRKGTALGRGLRPAPGQHARGEPRLGHARRRPAHAQTRSAESAYSEASGSPRPPSASEAKRPDEAGRAPAPLYTRRAGCDAARRWLESTWRRRAQSAQRDSRAPGSTDGPAPAASWGSSPARTRRRAGAPGTGPAPCPAGPCTPTAGPPRLLRAALPAHRLRCPGRRASPHGAPAGPAPPTSSKPRPRRSRRGAGCAAGAARGSSRGASRKSSPAARSITRLPARGALDAQRASTGQPLGPHRPRRQSRGRGARGGARAAPPARRAALRGARRGSRRGGCRAARAAPPAGPAARRGRRKGPPGTATWQSEYAPACLKLRMPHPQLRHA
jgi:hypothetical protein